VTPEEIGARLVEAMADGDTAAGAQPQAGVDAQPQADGDTPADEAVPAVVASVSAGGPFARATVDVPPARWREAALAVRDVLGCDFFDWLSAVDEGDNGFAIVLHVWSTAARHGVLVRTMLPRATPTVDSILDIYPGANWNERETHEMFGVDFAGHPNLIALLLPAEFEGHPLRKEFVLASRVAKPWPGAKEPGEGAGSGGSGRARQPARPLGVPSPDEWGPKVAPPID